MAAATNEPRPRRLSLHGATNFRDIGGYPVAGRGTTRWGAVYRSDAPHRLSAHDLVAVARLGLRVSYDLRTAAEHERAPAILPTGVRRASLPIGGTAAQRRALAGHLAEVPEDFLPQVYLTMADRDAGTFGRLLTALAAPGGLPALVHCTAGKDRTGIAMALLLTVLGVGEPDVLDDYELSAAHYTAPRLARLAARGVDVTGYDRVLDAPRPVMAALLAALRERHGTVESYLTRHAGVSPATLAALRDRLVQ
jgi:protein-tyrosine phosphatase